MNDNFTFEAESPEALEALAQMLADQMEDALAARQMEELP